MIAVISKAMWTIFLWKFLNIFCEFAKSFSYFIFAYKYNIFLIYIVSTYISIQNTNYKIIFLR